MGFSVAAAAGIVLTGFVFYGGTLLTSAFNAQKVIQEAHHASELRFASVHQSTIQWENHSFDGAAQRLYINLTNDGGIPLDANDVELLLDGFVQTSSIVERKINGLTTDVWAPQTHLLLVVSAGSDPNGIAVVAATGAAAYWRA